MEFTGTRGQYWQHLIVRAMFDDEVIKWRSIKQEEFCFMHKIIKQMEVCLTAIAKIEIQLRKEQGCDDSASNLASRIGSYTVAVILSIAKLFGRGMLSFHPDPCTH